MYQVYCDDTLIYHPGAEDLKIEDATVSQEVNKTGSFQFTIYPSHVFYDTFRKMKSIITVFSDDEVIFRGRLINEEIGLYQDKRIECEGELAFFLDSVQRNYSFNGTVAEFLQHLINRHNEQVEEEKQFKMGKCTVDNGSIVRSTSVYDSTLKNIEDKLINNEGAAGYLVVRHEADGVYLDYLKDFERTCSQNIVLSENLIDLTKKSNAGDIVTAIIPLGATQEGEEGQRIDITSVNGGKDYIYSQDAVDRYGWITKMVQFEDITVPANLLIKVQQYLDDAIKMSNSIELSALDLHLMEREIESFKIGQYVNVISEAHKINEKYPITKMTIDLLEPDNNTLMLGFDYKTFTEQQSNSSGQGTNTNPSGGGADSDTGWKIVKLLNNCVAYDAESIPKVRKLNNVIELRGAIKTTQANTLAGVVFGEISAEYRPSVGNISILCQGDEMNTWLLTISSGGDLTASRYGSADYANMTGNERLDFQATYTV